MATITGTCDNSRYTLTCEYSVTQNVTANTSTIAANVYLAGNGYTTDSSYWSCVINGVTVTSNKSAAIGNKTLLGSRTWTVNHNNDGTCTTTISFSYSNGLSSAGTYTTKTGSGSASVTLATIPRGSTISLNRTSATIGSDAITISLSRASNSYTHKVQLYFGSYSALLAEGVGTSYTFTPNMTLCNQIPNATSGTATIKVQTMNGNTWVAETTKTITLNVPSSVVPTIGSVTLTGNNLLGSVYVAHKSTVTAKINNASGAYGSTIKSYSISGAGISSTSSSATSNTLSAGAYTITAKVTDSRGRTASKSASITVHAYYAPSLNIDLYRCNADGIKTDEGVCAKVRIKGTIHNVGSANVNIKKYRIEKKIASSTTWTTIEDWAELSSYESDWVYDLGDGWDNEVTYDVRVSFKDSYNTVMDNSSIGTLLCLFNIEQNGIGIGKIHERGALDVGGEIYINGKYKMASSGGTGNLDLGNVEHPTGIHSSETPYWWDGKKKYPFYCEANKPTPKDIGARADLVPTTGNWFQGTPVVDTDGVMEIGKAIDFHNTTTSTDSYDFRLTTSGSGNFLLVYKNTPTNSTGAFCPNTNGSQWLGLSGNKWAGVFASNGTLQTSDARFKVKRGLVNANDCFQMVKDISLYKYIMLEQNKEALSKNRLGKLAMANENEETRVHIGLMAQDLLSYECGKYILVEGEYEKGEGITDTMLHINPLDMTMAVMGALKEEIQRREQLEERITKLEGILEK